MISIRRMAFAALVFVAANACADPFPHPRSLRAFGMGEAYSAVADDASAIFYNPAGLTQVKFTETSTHFGRYVTDGLRPQNDWTAYGSLPLKEYKPKWDRGTIAVSLSHTGRKDDSSLTRLGSAWGFPAKKILPRSLPIANRPWMSQLHSGVAFHIDRLGRDDSNALGMGVDLGWLYFLEEGKDIWHRGWSLALVIQDANLPTASAPVTYRLGSAWRTPYATFALDWVVKEGISRFQPGAEIPFFRKLLRLRLGTADTEGPSRQLTVGLGIVLAPAEMGISYGFPLGNALGNDDTIVLGFTYRFGMPHLSQYFYQERLERATEVEEKVVALEDKRRTLAAEVAENRDLQKRLARDMEEAITQRSRAADEAQKLTEQIKTLKKQAEEAEKALAEIKKDPLYEAAQKNKYKQQKIFKRPGENLPPLRYRVVSGDTLRGISEKHYGTPEYWRVIYDANVDKMIRGAPKVGTELVIP